MFRRQRFLVCRIEEGYELLPLLCEPIVFCWQEPVFFDAVDFQQFCFEAIPEVTVDFFAVKVEAAMIKLIHVTGSPSEHIKKLQRLHQVAEFGAFLGTTTQQ
jgi:hypothetical protein